MDSYFHQACTRCRSQKRKCSRLLPVCARCKRLNLRCHYPQPTHHYPSPEPSVSKVELPFLTQSPLSSLVCSTTGDIHAVSESVAAYFSTVHAWFPILNRDAYTRTLSGLHKDLSPDFNLLTLCIYLIGLTPEKDGMSSHMNALYIHLSGAVASLTAAGVTSLDLLHSRLLLSLFELGHGLYPAADISMGANIRAATAIGCHHPSDQLQTRLGSPEAAGDARRIWQGIVILDRCIALGRGNPSTTSLEITPDVEDPPQLSNLLLASNHLPTILNHVYGLTPYEEKAAEAVPALQALAAFRSTLSEPNETSLAYPGAALCSSAFMTILEFGYRLSHPLGRDCGPLSFALLEAEIQQFVKSAESLERSVLAGDMPEIPVFAIHAIGTAAVTILRHFRDTGSIDVAASVQCLKGLLEGMGMRWVAAGVHLAKIRQTEESCGN
ncbi:hypothetical protein BJX70DRAFT_380225 [Aspergillus crustosus]